MFGGENAEFWQRAKSLLFARWEFLEARETEGVPGSINGESRVIKEGSTWQRAMKEGSTWLGRTWVNQRRKQSNKGRKHMARANLGQ